ncbi:MAG: glycoside hydrolase family 3 C-terminal domain-containing protein [Saccharofermentans sp.]|nr:glycoside hydrolase family 3 C-terminal domain-containing protein [Saccharofermentans sp.]
MSKWVRHIHQIGLPLGEDGTRVTGSKKHINLSCQAATEGMVLLKNNNQMLPLKNNPKVALFGKASVDYVKGGGGSGDVTVAYSRSLYEGLKLKETEGKVQLYHDLADYYSKEIDAQYAEGIAPGMTEEPEIPSELIKSAAEFADIAVITLCRFSGEAWDRKVSLERDDSLWDDQLANAQRQAVVFPDGDYCVAPKEQLMIDAVKANFKNIVVVLNIGGVIETSWIKDDDQISSALLMWQGGIEGGLAAANLLVGDDTPSGKLVDTFAKSLDDYPSSYNFHESNAYAEYTDDIYVGYRYFETIPGARDKVVYPFGYGLSYTSFDKEVVDVTIGDEITVKVRVTNSGDYSGKEVVMLYYSCPQGVIGKPSRELGAFVKTARLAPGENEVVTLVVKASDMASYDDVGKVIKSAWILEKGTYNFYIGDNIETLTKLEAEYVVETDTVVAQLEEMLAPSNLTKRLLPDGSYEPMSAAPEKVLKNIYPRMTTKEAEGIAPCLRGRDLQHLRERKEIMFDEVADGKATLDEFMAQLSVDELIHLLGGQPNLGVANTFGVGNMPEYAVPEVLTADGPAGLRILPHIGVNTTAWPCATMLACTFNTEVAQAVGEAVAKEVKENNIGIWLAPAVNIHRTPMCGRNFEYYSEDPVVAGKIGTGVVKGVQSQNIAATVKHFAFNNKETNRKSSDSRVSERAAREIYLKAFEIIVKEADPWCIMTSYNKVNGIQCSESEELLNGILRGQWGYKGLVMTDWWTLGEHYLEAKAGNDLKMANGYPARVRKAYDEGEITVDELYKAARNILSLILKME